MPATTPEVVERVAAELLTLATVERMHIYRVMEACGGNLSAASQILDIHRRSLQRKLRAYERKAARAAKAKAKAPGGRARRPRAEANEVGSVIAELQRRMFS